MGNVISLVGTLFMVVLILAGCYWVTRRLGKMSIPSRHSRYMEVVDSIPVGQDRSIMIVRVGGQCLLIGSSSDGLRLLASLKPEDMKEIPSQASGKGTTEFKDLLMKVRNRNKEQ